MCVWPSGAKQREGSPESSFSHSLCGCTFNITEVFHTDRKPAGMKPRRMHSVQLEEEIEVEVMMMMMMMVVVEGLCMLFAAGIARIDTGNISWGVCYMCSWCFMAPFLRACLSACLSDCLSVSSGVKRRMFVHEWTSDTETSKRCVHAGAHWKHGALCPTHRRCSAEQQQLITFIRLWRELQNKCCPVSH